MIAVGYDCVILADSLAPSGKRLTSFQITFPRFILAELNTHRLLSRNSASSRAIPVEKRIAAVEADPFIPREVGRNQKGMQAGENLDPRTTNDARGLWRTAARDAIRRAKEMADLGAHKQLANRLLEPFLWHTAIVTATEWSNFFAQRCHPDAQPEFRAIAEMMRAAIENNSPRELDVGAWHLPYIATAEMADLSDVDAREVSVARCARVSYLTQDGRRDIDKDLELFHRLASANPMHASPFEHVACALEKPEPSGNFIGWMQYRKLFAHEHRGSLRFDNRAADA